MVAFSSEDRKAMFTFELADFHNANGSESYALRFNVVSHGFAVNVESVWFDKSDLVRFSESLRHLSDGNDKKATVKSIPDFQIEVIPKDRLGHFFVKFTMESPMLGNSSVVVVELLTQDLIELSMEIDTILGGCNTIIENIKRIR